MPSIDSRTKIMDTAIEMFNDKGVSSVTTAQIASRLGMSPSNLYYYFENKEHLIRCIWTEKIAPNVAALFYDEEVRLSESGIIKFFSSFSAYIIEYSFFYLELYSILAADAQIRQAYTERTAVLMGQILDYMDTWIRLGIMRETSPADRKLLAENMWVIGQSYSSYTMLIRPDSPPRESSTDSVLHAYSLLRPYLTDEANTRILRLLEVGGNGIDISLLEGFIEISGNSK